MDLMGDDEIPFIQKRDIIWIVVSAATTYFFAMDESAGIILLEILGTIIFCILGFRFIPDEAAPRWLKVLLVTSLCTIPADYIVDYINPKAKSSTDQQVEMLQGQVNQIRTLLKPE